MAPGFMAPVDDRDKCGLHLEGHQRVSDGLGKGADQTGL